MTSARTQHTSSNAFIWNDHGRFVEVHPIELGWMVVWGHYEELGAVRIHQGNAHYRTLDGARRRLVDSALELTRRPQAAAQAAKLFGFFKFRVHEIKGLPEPL